MNLTEELLLMNKNRNRLKRFRKYENTLHKENNFMEIDFGYIFRVTKSQFGKALGLNQ